jgi:hypothetical protein
VLAGGLLRGLGNQVGRGSVGELLRTADGGDKEDQGGQERALD